jgi:hypothetical protein
MESPQPPLTIVTPCSRPENLEKLYKSIQFDKITLWLIIYDTRKLNFEKRFNDPKIIELECKDEGIVGHQIRNMSLNIITQGLIYFLDDDNIIHPFFWYITNHFKEGSIHTFNLLYQNGSILKGENPAPKNIDIAQCVFDKSLVGDIRFNANNYSADSVFISELCNKNKDTTQIVYFNYIATYYNWLNEIHKLPQP